MIGYLKGKVIYKHLPEVWLEVLGVGYRVKVGKRTYEAIQLDEAVELYIHTHVRQDALELFGFTSREELALFELLLTVSGVGPKSALGIIGTEAVERIEKAVREADVAFFKHIPGLGTKTAQRIIVDLKSKIGSIKELDFEDEGEGDEVTLALMQFGFKRGEVKDVRAQLDSTMAVEMQVKEGLKRLGKRM